MDTQYLIQAAGEAGALLGLHLGVGLVEEVEHILKVQVHLFLSGAGALLGHAQGSDALGRGTGDEGCGGPKGESDDGGAEHSFRREVTQTTWKTW